MLDSSCFVASYSYNGSNDAYVGGIIGECKTKNGPCIVENTVNIASVAFIGGTIDNLCLGGIVGWISSSSIGSTVKNCANYGPITHSGEASYAYIGGITGYFFG